MRWWHNKGIILFLAASMPITSAISQKSMEPVPIGSPADWITPDDYPLDANLANRSGRVVAKVDIDATGHVANCSIKVSSGTDSLDRKTCEIMMLRASFNPATDAKGNKIASAYALSIYWKTPSQATDVVELSSHQKTESTNTETETIIDEGGKILSCRNVIPLDETTLDPCAKVIIGSSFHTDYRLNGRPIRALVRQHVSRTNTVTPALAVSK